MAIRFDEQPVGAIATRQELQAGRRFTLPDGSKLWVQLVKRSMDNELHVLRNDHPVPGSYTDPETRYRLAYGVVLGIMAFHLLLGFIAMFTRSPFLERLGVGAHTIALGTIFVFLGFYVKRRSAIALGVAIAILLADGLLAAALAVLSGRVPGILGLVIRGLLVFPMLDGIRAIREMKVELEII